MDNNNFAPTMAELLYPALILVQQEVPAHDTLYRRAVKYSKSLTNGDTDFYTDLFEEIVKNAEKKNRDPDPMIFAERKKQIRSDYTVYDFGDNPADSPEDIGQINDQNIRSADRAVEELRQEFLDVVTDLSQWHGKVLGDPASDRRNIFVFSVDLMGMIAEDPSQLLEICGSNYGFFTDALKVQLDEDSGKRLVAAVEKFRSARKTKVMQRIQAGRRHASVPTQPSAPNR